MNEPAAGRAIWRSADVEDHRGFAYYRDGICRSFMDLVPEPDKNESSAFSGSVESIPIGKGRLNRVVATSHLVLRTSREIARSRDECFYLNLKTRGECRIRQSGVEVVITAGDVGLFDSTKTFALEHRRKPDLAVSSFMLPFGEMRERLRGQFPKTPLLLSTHPSYGELLREVTATLAREVDHLPAHELERLFEFLLDLVALAASPNRSPVVDAEGSRAAASHIMAKRYIRDHCRMRGLTADNAAAALGISVRYLHRLFENSERSFREFLLHCRLDAVASELVARDKSRRTIASIALSHGFTDAAHFHRTFKVKFGCTAGEWRRSAVDRSVGSDPSGSRRD
ncbi:helix-turn-helix domain-containing protein [Rhodopseudomonas sp.]|uniref:helix-turn-helix domain-containing protein n=1 Tax=Rhodopseudomonas sp. TaxID=1078 RepID=UPI003B3A1418